MAILKTDNYNGWEVKTGDDEFDAEMGEQLKFTPKELRSAINAENLTDVLFARIMKDRKEKHAVLLKKMPGTTSE
jgi:hypothetical protein